MRHWWRNHRFWNIFVDNFKRCDIDVVITSHLETVSNCGTPTEKVSEFLDHHLQPVMKEGKSCIKDIADFLDKLKDLGEIPEGAVLVTADVVGLCPSIPHTERLEVLSNSMTSFCIRKYPQKISLKWRTLYQKTIFLSLIPSFSNQYLELLLVLNFLPYMLVFLWTTLKQNFLRHNL